MLNDIVEIGDIVMLRYNRVEPQPHSEVSWIEETQPHSEVPWIKETQAIWHDDVEAIVVSGPSQGSSINGRWLEWMTQRLDDGKYRVIANGKWGAYSCEAFRIVRRVNE